MNFVNTLAAITAANENRPGVVPTVPAPVVAVPHVIGFQPGKTYQTRSIGDWDCIYTVKVVARSGKVLTVEVRGKLQKNIAKVVDGVEQFKPFGNYSMCAIICANKETA